MCAPLFQKSGVQAAHNTHSTRNEATVFLYALILPSLPAWSLCSSYLMREQYPLTLHCYPYHQPPDSNNHVQDFLCSCISTFPLLQNTLGLSHTHQSIKDCAGKQDEHRGSSYLAETSFHSTITMLAVQKEQPHRSQNFTRYRKAP